MTKNKSVFVNIVLMIVVLVSLVVVLEYGAVLYSKMHVTQIFGYRMFYNVERDDTYGHVLKENFFIDSRKFFSENDTIYQANYTTDQYGRRIIVDKLIKNDSHVIMLGDSFFYGEGLNDKDTLQHKLQAYYQEADIVNYAVPEYGPNHLLKKLQDGLIREQVKPNNGIALYGFIPQHIVRAIPSTTGNNLFYAPYYKEDENGTIGYVGNVLDDESLKVKFYHNFFQLKMNSTFLQRTNINFPIVITEKDLDTVSKIIVEMRDEYERQFNGTFYMVTYPYIIDEKSRYVINKIKESNVNVLEFDFAYTEDLFIPVDHHPNDKMNDILAKSIYEKIEKNN